MLLFTMWASLPFQNFLYCLDQGVTKSVLDITYKSRDE